MPFNNMATYTVLFLLFCIGYSHGQFGEDDKLCNEVLTAVDRLEVQVEALKLQDTAQKHALNSQAETIKRLEEQIKRLAVQKDQQKDVSTPRKRFLLANDGGLVAFTAKINTQTVENVAIHDTILFPNVDLNAGTGYDPATGKFVAPASGVYMFSLSLLAHNNANYVVHGEIVHNNVPVARALAVGEPLNHRDQGAVTALVNLLHNDEVWIRNVDFHNVTVGGDMFSVFSGYLLWPSE